MAGGSVPADFNVTKTRVEITGANRGAAQQNEVQEFQREFPVNLLTGFIDRIKQQLRVSRGGGPDCLGGSLKLSFPAVVNDRNQNARNFDVKYEVVLTFGDHNNAQPPNNTPILAHLNGVLAPKNWRATHVTRSRVERNGNNPVRAA